mmetsp:Transcript_37019/g.89983  ORF Transcript_37019/g.89983 Transcript_37019/m.89983 type:complete len:423 (+) Transcript_37019:965-2233(+)|eukprot:CAMPEP_0113640220 /NCGR_PEP_ID=MMETSP0017_2-20120614/21107_1 /TAXON_ID=2856 /ORGANISM="Cylindrotheca closterium" /LENGTH=422 /DNA_ID=CAMNT_0000551487 /DNA_START=773 /DNA_END=2041 /DNA_ORIENTATION=- /assembly_acc=CAM_ASM_000147
MYATCNKVTDADRDCFPPFHSMDGETAEDALLSDDLENLASGKRDEARDLQKVLPTLEGGFQYLPHVTSTTLGIDDNTSMCGSALAMNLDLSASSYDFGPITNCLTTMNQVDFVPGEDTSAQEFFSTAMPPDTSIEDDSSFQFNITREEVENNMIPQVPPSINVHRVTPVHDVELLPVSNHEIATSKQEIKPLGLTNKTKYPFGPPCDLVANDIVCQKDECGNDNTVNKRHVKKTRKTRAKNNPTNKRPVKKTRKTRAKNNPTNKRLVKKTRKTCAKNNAVVKKGLVKKIRKTRRKKTKAEKIKETRDKMKDPDGPPIRDLHPEDILCDRGTCGNEYPANKRLLEKVRKALPDYEDATRKKKTAMFKSYASSVISSGGRFLVRLNKDAPWMEAKFEVGRKKISHTFRDQAQKKKVAAMEIAV